eukprot:15115527-Alexandrium_andersonii.AAC.1
MGSHVRSECTQPDAACAQRAATCNHGAAQHMMRSLQQQHDTHREAAVHAEGERSAQRRASDAAF